MSRGSGRFASSSESPPTILAPAAPAARTRRSGSLFAIFALAAAGFGPSRAEAALGDPDTMNVRFEVGASSDVTNEQFYEDAFVDSISLGRRLVSSPESRFAAVTLVSIGGTRSLRATHYQIQNELSYGDKVKRDALLGSWRSEFAPDWRFAVAPRLEYRNDHTFGRDLEEWRGALGMRLRRAFAEGSAFAELGASGDFLRSSGEGADFLLDRNSGKGSISVESIPLWGAEWRLGYSLAARAFPDSSERDHLEHRWEGHWKRSFESGSHVTLETDGSRRSTLEPAPTSRDRFWQLEGALEGEGRLSEAWALRARAAFEGLEYDVEDTTLFFNYRIYRAKLTPRHERSDWSLAAGPRAEALESAREPGEEYRELAGLVELEYLGRGSWWNVSPAAGWRDYGDAASSDTLGLGGLHSSYAFAELNLLADQGLPGALRLRLLATTRFEWHIDPAQDARSLYFSLDLRRVF